MRTIRYCIFSLAAMLMFGALPTQAQTFYHTTSSDAAITGFASSVAVGDEAIFIGEPGNQYNSGLIYIYEKENGAWQEQTKLSASDASWADHFGQAIDVDDEWLLTGATHRNEERGGAYLFQRAGDSWEEAAILAPEDAESGDRVGATVALAGDVAVVGAPSVNESQGVVFVFERAGDTWEQQARLTASSAQPNANFGGALALGDNHLFVGAAGQDSSKGSVYVFHRNDDGSWEEHHTLRASNLDDEALFGATMALRDNTLLVGAPRNSSTGGAVYAFTHEEGEGWQESGRAVPFDGSQRTFFGSSIQFSDDGAWVGAMGAGGFEGRVYRFNKNDEGEWTGVSKLYPAGLERGDLFGSSMAVADEHAVVGMSRADGGAGSAFIFEQTADGQWEEATQLEGEVDALASVTGEEVPCGDGEAGMFDCSNVNMLSFMNIQDLGGERGISINDMWGWSDEETGKTYALVGRTNGLAFVDISDPVNPVYVGDVPMTPGANAAAWRDVKVYEDHAFIVADGSGEHGMQVFDLTRLREYDGTPKTYEADALYENVDSSHNIAINTETGYAYIVGAGGGGTTCGGGLHMVNVQDPKNPTFAGCFADESTGRRGTGYSHDVQCVNYQGPDSDYEGREICLGSNETALSIADVTDKENPEAISVAPYPNVSYAHQGWLTEDHRYFYMNDELDELSGKVEQTRTMIWDVSDLDDPQLVKEYTWGPTSSDHNLYVEGDMLYMSNYASGLRVHDISDPENPSEIAYFDTTPAGDSGPGFTGSWSNYPYFDNGVIGVTSSGEGFFLLKVEEDTAL